MNAENLIEIAQFYNAAEAQMARGALESGGLECVLFDVNHHSIQPYLQMAMPVRLMVRNNDAAAARALLNEIHAAPPAEEPSLLPRTPQSLLRAAGSLLLYLLGGAPLGYSAKKKEKE